MLALLLPCATLHPLLLAVRTTGRLCLLLLSRRPSVAGAGTVPPSSAARLRRRLLGRRILLGSGRFVRSVGPRPWASGSPETGGRDHVELARDGRSRDNRSGRVSLDGRCWLHRHSQGGKINLPTAGGSNHSQFCGLGSQILGSLEVLHLLCQILVLLGERGLFGPELTSWY